MWITYLNEGGHVYGCVVHFRCVLHILALEIVDKRESLLNSGVMEATGIKKAMQDLDNTEISVIEVVIDAHMQIESIMSKICIHLSCLKLYK